jgi:hypothetical protein
MSRPASELAHLFRALKAPAAARALPKLADRARSEEWSFEQFAAAGGSTTWGVPEPDPRVKAIMGLAIGAQAITSSVDLADVTVPAVLVAGGLDRNSTQAVSENAFTAISSADKLFVGIPNAVHRSFDSTYCAQLQSAGAAADADHDGVVEAEELPPSSPAILDLHTVRLIAASPPLGNSGKAVHYCASEFFTSPVDIRKLVASTDNAEFPPAVGPPSVCLSTSTPCTGLETEEVKKGVKEIAAAFFDTALKRNGNDGIRFSRYLTPTWLMKHVPMVGSAQAYAGPGSVCPPGQGVTCAD